MFFEREPKRLTVFAHISMNNDFLGSTVLKDLSLSGCRIESSLPINITEGEICVITIHPDETLNVGDFDIVTKVHWIGNGQIFEAGFIIIEKLEGTARERLNAYLEYYADSPGNSPFKNAK